MMPIRISNWKSGNPEFKSMFPIHATGKCFMAYMAT